jgi:hypothetical protein
MTTPAPAFRIAAKQAPAAKAKQALMIAANELGVFTFYFPCQLGDAEQRESLRTLLAEQFDSAIPMPEETTGVFHLVVLDGVPLLIPENDALAFTAGVVLARLGLDAARRVSYRPEMLPAPKE